MLNILSSSYFSFSKKTEQDNSDFVLMPKRLGHGYIFAIADGVGKKVGASVASLEAIRYLEEITDEQEILDLKSVFENIRTRLKELAKKETLLYSMATTLTVCYVTSEGMSYAHTGDTRLYIKNRNNKLEQLTKDQTEHEHLISEGVLTRNQVKRLPRKNVLYSVLSPKSELNIEMGNITNLPDSIFLMSDGAYDFWEKDPRFSSSTMKNVCHFASSLQKRIIRKGPKDDFSFIGVEFHSEVNNEFNSEVNNGINSYKKRDFNFRKRVLNYWEACAVTGTRDLNLLFTTHIKPLSRCNSDERIDIFNGLALTPNLHSAFDRGLITFDNSGKLMCSSQIVDASKLGIYPDMNIKLEERHLPYMKYHREYVFKA
jgi:serine/threonine protein phosphatase PrpC